MIKQEVHAIKGMQRDLTVSKFNPEFAFDAQNIRITARDNNTLLSITNEKGTKESIVEGDTLTGDVIGYCVLNSYLVLFTTDNGTDCIFRLEKQTDKFISKRLYRGNLNLNPKYPLETLGVFESSDIQKVYWVDSLNSPRVINIIREYYSDSPTLFDFVPELKLKENIEVTRNDEASGLFASGVIQYAFSYYNRYGQQSTIFYTTPVQYISYADRGASPEDKVPCSFTLNITGIDTEFDYLRIYSIHRTSLDATPTVTLVVDVSIQSDTVTYTDNGTTGETIDPTELLYIGGEDIVAGTMTAKDNTLFLGNIKLRQSLLPEDLVDRIKNHSYPYFSTTGTTLNEVDQYDVSGYYTYKNQLQKGSQRITSFKSGETYRLGLQFQYKNGKWSEVIYLDDVVNNSYPIMNPSHGLGGTYEDIEIKRVIGATILGSNLITELYNLGYRKVRPVVVYPSLQDRTVVVQGIVCPTVFKIGDRVSNSPFVQSSWNARFSNPYDYKRVAYNITNGKITFYNVDNSLGWFTSGTALDAQITGWYVGEGPRKIRLGKGYMSAGGVAFGAVALPIEDSNIDIYSINPTSGYLYPITSMGTTFVVCPAYKGFDYSFDGNPRADWKNPDTGRVSEESPAGSWNTIEFKVTDDNNTSTTEDDVERTLDMSAYGNLVEFRHNYPIPNNYEPGAEIQSLCDGSRYVTLLSANEDTLRDTQSTYRNYFYVDQNIVTMHSPDIEFDDSVQNLHDSNLKFRIVGYVQCMASDSNITLNGTTYGNDVSGFYNRKIGSLYRSVNAWKGIGALPFWIDRIWDKRGDVSGNDIRGFVVYPFHRNGSLNNCKAVEEGTRPAMLQSKKSGNFKFCGSTIFLNTVWNAEQNDTVHNGITPIQIFNSDEVTNLRIKSPENSGLPNLNYYGNIDTVLPPDTDNKTYYAPFNVMYGDNSGMLWRKELNRIDGYPICVTRNIIEEYESTSDAYNRLFSAPICPLDTYPVDLHQLQGQYGLTNGTSGQGKDPVEMKYKTTPHIVFALNYAEDGGQCILPTNSILNETCNSTAFSDSHSAFLWDTLKREVGSRCSVHQDTIADGIEYPYLWLGELYRETVDNRFGGDTPEAILNNIWYPAGIPVIINPESSGNTTIYYTVGDTFLTRYDCLKAYTDVESTNGVAEVVSFMCESRVNVDGRYDRNIGQTNTLTLNPTNSNLINDVYTQKDNYFTYHTVDYSRFSNNYFPVTIVWSKEKHNSSEIDEWTSFNMASSLDLDGDKGEIVSLNTFNNEIFCFQTTGLSNILFNNRVQIPTSDNVPIEITNGLKVEGKRYISNTIGCGNKWSIVTTPNGIYFIDNITNSLYLFNGQIDSLSDRLGFRQWISENNSNLKWGPLADDFNNFVSYYDKNNNDIYFINKGTALVYSELLQQFTSFMDYGGVPYMFNIGSDYYSIKDNMLYENFAGDYNIFYGEYKPYSVTFISNADEPYDKIFNTVEFRADCWTKDEHDNEVLSNNSTFDTLEVWNEYQKGISSLTNTAARPSPLKKKFRVWRANVPRANTDWNGVKANRMDRIRNTWAYVKLSMNEKNTDRMEFHDMIVHYFV